MSSPFNDNNKNGKAQNDKKFNRATVITLITLALAVIIVSVAAVIANRQNKPNNPIPSDPDSTENITDSTESTEEPTEQESSSENNTEKPTQKPTNSSQAGNKVPSFILPVSGVLSSKHDPDLQVFSPTMNDYRVHLGVDLVTKEDAPVYSVADGTVSKIWVDPLMGYCMAISHAGNCVSIYKNLAEELPTGIVEGKSVRSGQLIASVGDSAMIEIGSEPHLHFEMTVSDLAVDPLKYFDEDALETIKADTSHE